MRVHFVSRAARFARDYFILMLGNDKPESVIKRR